MRRTLKAAITLVSTAALVSSVTVAAAQASPASQTRPAATQHRASPHAAARAALEHFRIISTSAGSSRQSVLARGQFTAGGYMVPGKVVKRRATDKIVFRSGTFRMARHITRQWLPLPTSACLIRETIHGRYSLRHGTGAFAGISGSGSFALRIRGVIRRSHGKCGGPMTVFQQITYAGGPTSR